MTHRKGSLVRMTSALCLTLWLGACSDSGTLRTAEGGSAKAHPIISMPVHWESQQTRVEAVGTSRAWRSVMLYPDATGEVVEVKFNAGDKVRKGDVLLKLEAEDERLAVELAKVELADAERLLDRYNRTQGSGAVTPSDLDAAESAVRRAEISLQRAEEALKDRTLRAPFDGHMGLTTIDPGARIGEDTPVASIDDRSVLLVSFELPEIVLGQLKVGDKITLSTWTNNRERTSGTVVDIDSRVDPQTRTFQVRAHVNNESDNLRPGMSFRVVLNMEGGRYPVVPEVALQWGGDGAYVWAIEDGKAARVPATIVQRRDGSILLDADLPEGTPIVAEGVQRMRQGQPVRDVGDSPPPKPPAEAGAPGA